MKRSSLAEARSWLLWLKLRVLTGQLERGRNTQIQGCALFRIIKSVHSPPHPHTHTQQKRSKVAQNCSFDQGEAFALCLWKLWYMQKLLHLHDTWWFTHNSVTMPLKWALNRRGHPFRTKDMVLWCSVHSLQPWEGLYAHELRHIPEATYGISTARGKVPKTNQHCAYKG